MGFFFPFGGGGGAGRCQCSVCPQPVTCAPAPTCAIPLPCPTPTSYVSSISAPSYQSQYQGSWQPAIPASYEQAPIPIPSPQQPVALVPQYINQAPPIPYQTAVVPYQTSAVHYRTVAVPYQTPAPYQTVQPVYRGVEPVYQTVVPTSITGYVAQQQSRYSNPVQPIQPVQTVASPEQYQESVKEQSQYPTLTQTPPQISGSGYDTDAHLQNVGAAFDDSSPALAPPAPSATAASYAPSVDYGTTPEVTDPNVQDNEALLVPASASQNPVAQFFDENGNSIERLATTQSLHSAATTDSEWVEVPAHRGRISTEGYSPYNKRFGKRHWILKRLRNARQLSAPVPRTNTTCNSKKLANLMEEVMVEDVSISKRTVLHASEVAFDGEKFDVFCATGEFSYSIHSRKYCEVTRNEITCFAFR